VRKVYRGRDVEVSFDLDICIHIAECLRGDPGVFKLDRRPWVLPDESEPDQVAEIVERCPTGALLYRRLDGGRQEEHPGTKVTPMRNGPLLVTGEIEVRREDGTVETLPRATLSRAGGALQDPPESGASEAGGADQQVSRPAPALLRGRGYSGPVFVPSSSAWRFLASSIRRRSLVAAVLPAGSAESSWFRRSICFPITMRSTRAFWGRRLVAIAVPYLVPGAASAAAAWRD